jgi:hypothetical protein
MKPGFHFWLLKTKSSESGRCTHIHQTNREILPARRLMAAVFRDMKGVPVEEFKLQETTIVAELYC